MRRVALRWIGGRQRFRFVAVCLGISATFVGCAATNPAGDYQVWTDPNWSEAKKARYGKLITVGKTHIENEIPLEKIEVDAFTEVISNRSFLDYDSVTEVTFAPSLYFVFLTVNDEVIGAVRLVTSLEGLIAERVKISKYGNQQWRVSSANFLGPRLNLRDADAFAELYRRLIR